MGTLLRRFWLPALLAEELSEAGGPTVRIRLMGEDLVAFRDSSGAIGLLGEHCPHRRTSLALGLNASGGLRCIFHGYKFNVEGRCLETPTEPEDSNFRSKIRATAYPTVEAGGMIWTYMGPPESQPAFPRFPFLALPIERARPYKLLSESNFFQALEGTVDSAHAGILHRTTGWDETVKSNGQGDLVNAPFLNLAPKMEVEPADFGLRYAALRTTENGFQHVRITSAVLPFWVFIPPFVGGKQSGRRLANAFVPRDDISTWHIQFFYDFDNEIDTEFRIKEGGYWKDAEHRKLRNLDNWYLQERDPKRRHVFSGIEGILTQDHAVSETQGAIVDRSQEHLGSSDAAVIAMRRFMLQKARAAANAPKSIDAEIPYEKIHNDTILIPADARWQTQAPLVKASA
jgi:phenylpropionate dioxygenase-like ring-hydroxylating dioxygenase large terminal subunit